MASSLAKWIADPKKNWLAAQHMKSLSTSLRRYGLRYDDLEHKEAMNRLPKEFADARNQRLKPAMDLSMKHDYFPQDLQAKSGTQTDVLKSSYDVSRNSISFLNRASRPSFLVQGILPPRPSSRCLSTTVELGNSVAEDASPSGVTPRIKYKRLDKTARHIMQILDKEAVGEVKGQREIPDIQPGYIIQLKVEVPENRRRVSTLKGIVIARRNAGLNTTFRLRRLVQGVGIESLFPLYSPNIKEIKVLEKKKVRRAKLYYLRDRMNALRK